MAIQKKPLSEDSDTLTSLRQEAEKTWEEVGELAQTTFENWLEWWDGQGEPAKTFQDPKRACFRCAGSLMIVEEADNGDVVLQCKSCHQRMWLSDVMPYTKQELETMEKEAEEAGGSVRNYPDEHYRTIPQSLINEYTEMRKRRNRQG